MNAAQRAQYDGNPSKKSTASISSKSSQPMKRFTTFGVSFDEIDRKEADRQKEVRTINVTIEEMLQTAELKDSKWIALSNLTNLTFRFSELMEMTVYMLSASYFVKTVTGGVFPAEIAMSKFNLVQGVHDTLHILVNPGKLPFGMVSVCNWPEPFDDNMFNKSLN